MNIKASCKDARLTLCGESRQYEGLRLTLKASNTQGDRSSLGTYLFGYRALTGKRHSMAWLYIDMMHLIMLIAEHCQVDIPVIQGVACGG